MRIEIPWTSDIVLHDLIELVRPHCKEIIIDGDHRAIVIDEPDEFLLEELENRGIKYETI